ncbi:hypothetical protein N656DRAFT_292227 [Canariomyces notabilis]|uniref:Uncharacterized protein n=1 Tax=Canariomyces notabilis TaxID=2074819 RepID=A0AAN6QMM6_9PEZI|nr:hypothetical protein N656DRAFT_292227 [Canariomyces arenarius]
MHLLLNVLATSLALAAPSLSQGITATPTIESVSGCPAVVSTTHVCSTCMTIQCVASVTITAGCGTCPASPPTIYRGYPCEEGCSALTGCKPVYTVVTAAAGEGGECEFAATATTTSTAISSGAATGSGTTTAATSMSFGEQSSVTGTGSTAGSGPASTGPVSVNAAARRVALPMRLW